MEKTSTHRVNRPVGGTAHRAGERLHPASFRLAVLGMIAVAVAVFSVTLLIAPKPGPTARVASLPDDMLPAELLNHPGFQAWLDSWRGGDGHLRAAEFGRTRVDLFDLRELMAASAGPRAADWERPRAGRYAWRSDGRAFIDYLADFGEPQVKVRLGLDDAALELASRERPGYFHEAFWWGDDRAVVLGHVADRDELGAPLCLTNQGRQECYGRFTVSVLDLALGKLTEYESLRHALPADPYRSAARAAWEASLRPVELARFGLPLGDAPTAVVTGRVAAVGHDGTMTLDAADGPLRLELSRQVGIIDERGAAATFEYLRRGVAVIVTAVPGGPDEPPVARQIVAASAPALLVYEPADGQAVAQFSLRALVRDGSAETLVIRLRNERTGRRVLDETVQLDAGSAPWQEVVYPFAIAEVSRPGDAYALAVFDPEDEGHAVQLAFVYEPTPEPAAAAGAAE